MKRLLTTAFVLCLVLCTLFVSCGKKNAATNTSGADKAAESGNASSANHGKETTNEAKSGTKTYKIGLCNFVDDASLNQIVENIEARLHEIEAEKGVKFTIYYDNCNADANVLNQIIANFIANKVDLMIGVATPVAMAMQAATEDNRIPVIFSAVSDPLGTGIVESLEKPGANITGTSDYLDSHSVLNLIFALKPEAKKIGLLYDIGQDASTTPVSIAKEVLKQRGVQFIERTGTTVDEVVLAAGALISDKVDAIFTPTDNTIMTAELSIYEALAKAGIPHFTGADSFALNGAFLGYGVDYANLGRVTADMVGDVLVAGMDPATLPVRTFDNGTATINTETAEALGYDYASLEQLFSPYATRVQPIRTAESF